MRTKPSDGSRLTTLLIVTLYLLASAQRCLANTEIVNFGPLLCRTDVQGREELFAAEKLAAEWPTLRVTDVDGIFTLDVQETKDPPGEKASPYLTQSQSGAWMKLEIAESSSQVLQGSHSSIPRDRFLQEVRNAFTWFLNLRFTVRASTAANIPADVTLRVLSAHNMLASGKLQRVAEASASNDTSSESSEADATSKDGPIVHIGKEPSSADALVDATAEPNSWFRSRTAHSDSSEEEVERWPCSVAYLHVIATRSAVRIPRRVDCASGGAGFRFAPWRYLRHVYFDRLAWDSRRPCSADECSEGTSTRATVIDSDGMQISFEQEQQPLTQIPLILTFERLHLGVLPTTAAYMLVVLIVTLALVRRLVLPPVLAHLSHIVAYPHEKTE